MWRTRRPVFGDDVVGPFVGCGDSGAMARRVVIYKDENLDWVSMVEGHDDVTQNLISFFGGGHVALDDLKGDLIVVQ